MNILPGFKLCRNKLHQYPEDKRRCPECQKESRRRWYEQNRERDLENKRHWREQNADRQREYKRLWQKQNPDKERAKCMRRKARKKKATPPWADHDAINAIYAEAVRLEQETGIKHHVDHIYPLQSKYLCGLHIAENLQVLPSTENIRKNNRTWPGQLDCQKARNPTFLTEI